MRHFIAFAIGLLAQTTRSLRYDPNYVRYNLNQNQTATDPVDYWGKWEPHDFFPSPDNWRFPFYTLFLDRFVNGDPTNDNINGTQFEHDLNSNQIRHGGDAAGFLDSLDYVQGMGIKGIYLAGTILINQPWGLDGYSPIDLTLLDSHYGDIEKWRELITEIHARGMYVIMDNTIATMSDLIGFDGHLNATTPFTLQEYTVQYKTDRQYLDFGFGNEYNDSCDYPRFWYESGWPVGVDVRNSMNGCYDSDFDQYGDVEAFGVFPDWQRQLSKFASVQDRLREWVPSVRSKIMRHWCLMIMMLDIDGFRYDKATQATVDALAEMSEYYRECARSVGKKNFFIPGEITGGDHFGSIYIGRGRQPDMRPDTIEEALHLTTTSEERFFIRERYRGALDAGAFHYSVYRSLTRFLGMDGYLTAGYDLPTPWVEAWDRMLVSNDFVNVNTGKFDPRHMYGVTNQDVFRWPAIKDGTQKMLLGLFVTTLHLPGIPKLIWGEEQAFYLLDSTAENYIFGRQAMSSATAWQTHGCFKLNSTQFYQFPADSARHGCNDPAQDYDHRDPSHPIRNILKSMYQMREHYPVLNDGFFLQLLSSQTRQIFYPGSNGTFTETGIWSVVRGQYSSIQDLSAQGYGNQSVWLIYQNDNQTVTYNFDCSNQDKAFLAPFAPGTTVKNLFYPYNEITLESSSIQVDIEGVKETNGCLSSVTLQPYAFAAYVPKAKFEGPRPMVTKFSPGHDARILSNTTPGSPQTVAIEFEFSEEMTCDTITNSISFTSKTASNISPNIRAGSAQCSTINADAQTWIGQIMGTYKWSAELENVYDGVHRLTLSNASSPTGSVTKAVDHFLFRVGQSDNPLVFTRTGNYSDTLLHRAADKSLYIFHKATGADSFRYSTSWGTKWSDWIDYTGGNFTISKQEWSGTSRQAWKGEHVTVEYWDRLSGSSAYVQHGDLEYDGPPRRYPHFYWNGDFNQYGYDGGLENHFTQDQETGIWKYRFLNEWPATAQANVWGMNPDGKPDQSYVLGDIDGDSILDRLPPSSLTQNLVNISEHPPRPHLAWSVNINDGTLKFELLPEGNEMNQLALFAILWIIPVLTAVTAVWAFRKSFYQVKLNQQGVDEKGSLGGGVFALAARFAPFRKGNRTDAGETKSFLMSSSKPRERGHFHVNSGGLNPQRRTILIATMEYDIEDWDIKIKIGGLGVMAQLMGKHLGHQNLIWVVPCVGDVEYPEAEPAEPMTVSILGNQYEVQVQYHQLRNITYVLLDAPVFRQQTKGEPYPARMDDLDSAIYYSAWNQCIAMAIKRFPSIDIYHINDYHGSLAPLYLLPQTTIPICLSLHNAEFQGLWPLRTTTEKDELAAIFNIEPHLVTRYVQFGDVFNLLHAAASYLRIHQQGFGAVGVSKKYGKRSHLRYPIFWGLRKVGKLPNPDPTDTDVPMNPLTKPGEVDVTWEASRASLRRQAQEWAGLTVDESADLCVFVGRWSTQKGIDLIADVFLDILERYPKVQLICVGPIIDLYGKFAALKLDKLSEMYPRRVYSKSEFTALPPFIFSGAEFALIPSRDEPFGLVAVEFGRKGALGIGARVGGLGQMPGWWYTVESMAPSHLLQQFKAAIEAALTSKRQTRAVMRANSGRQRFPVTRWVEDLEILQSTAIRVHRKKQANGSTTGSGVNTPKRLTISPSHETLEIPTIKTQSSRGDYSPVIYPTPVELSTGLVRKLSLGVRSGPGHRPRPSRGSNLTVPDSKGNDGSVHAEEAPTEYDYESSEDEHVLSPEQAQANFHMRTFQERRSSLAVNQVSPSQRYSSSGRTDKESRMSSIPPSPSVDSFLLPPRPLSEARNRFSNASLLSLDTIVGDRKDFKLQQVDPSFTDKSGDALRDFEEKLAGLDVENSETALCIETYLVKAEKRYFDRFREARLSRHMVSKRSIEPKGGERSDSDRKEDDDSYGTTDEFLLGPDYVPPTGLKRWMQLRLGDWPVYSFFLAFGQIIAANSYQVTLLSGEIGQTAEKLYAVASIYLISSIIWWLVFRWYKSVYCLSVPFVLYGFAFLFIGIAAQYSGDSRGWLQNVATGLYSCASASGSIFFALNFGDDRGAPVKDWVFRACTIQGVQHFYVVALWYWGSHLARQSRDGYVMGRLSNDRSVSAMTILVAFMLWSIGLIIYFGLPNYYHRAPGKVPSLFKSLSRRKIVPWFFVTVFLQNLFLSAPYGRNWSFLWSSQHAAPWQIMLLVLLFFVVIWGAMLYVMGLLSKNHTWILPVFAIGLGAPRWAQIWWGTSGIGLYVPWMWSYTSGALVSRGLWLWLGVLDAMQGVGFGMILLQTLTRIHVCFTLLAAQVIGSIATILAKGVAPNRLGPGPISPDISGGWHGVANAWFWIALGCQILICAGMLLFFRKEQLSKP